MHPSLNQCVDNGLPSRISIEGDPNITRPSRCFSSFTSILAKGIQATRFEAQSTFGPLLRQTQMNDVARNEMQKGTSCAGADNAGTLSCSLAPPASRCKRKVRISHAGARRPWKRNRPRSPVFARVGCSCRIQTCRDHRLGCALVRALGGRSSARLRGPAAELGEGPEPELHELLAETHWDHA